MRRFRVKISKVADQRVKLTQETLLGVRAVKLYAWEESFLAVIEKLRDRELHGVWSILMIRATVAGLLQVRYYSLPIQLSKLSIHYRRCPFWRALSRSFCTWGSAIS